MSKESYIRGFCKVAEAHGVDAVQLAKYAQVHENLIFNPEDGRYRKMTPKERHVASFYPKAEPTIGESYKDTAKKNMERGRIIRRDAKALELADVNPTLADIDLFREIADVNLRGKGSSPREFMNLLDRYRPDEWKKYYPDIRDSGFSQVRGLVNGSGIRPNSPEFKSMYSALTNAAAMTDPVAYRHFKKGN